MSILTTPRNRSTSSSSAVKGKGKVSLHPITSNTTVKSKANSSRSVSPRLTIASIANIFLKLRLLHRRSRNRTTCSSGTTPMTHPHLKSTLETQVDKIPLAHKDTFVCAGSGGVDAAHLLRATRKALMQQAEMYGDNALVDESWLYVIHEPRHRLKGQYRIDVHYTASAIQVNCRDTKQPVAMDKIQNIPGLMCIISRNEE